MVCSSTIIQRILKKINAEEETEEASDTFMEILDPESRATRQQTTSISVAISIGKILMFFIV